MLGSSNCSLKQRGNELGGGPLESPVAAGKVREEGGGELEPMPDYIHVTWYSLAEQQSYTRLIHIPDPDALRERMEQPAPVQRNGKTINMPRDTLVLGLAPGGTVVLWIMNWAETAIEVGRYQAVPFDDDVRYEGALEAYMEREGDYLKQHGLQLDRW